MEEELDVLKVAYIGSGCVNFGGAAGPWDHSKRLEQLGGIQFVAIVDPLVKKAEEVLKKKKDGPYAHLYTNCKVMGDYKELFSLGDDKPDAVFIGIPPFCRGSYNNDVELQMVRAGIHTFIEKPLSDQPPEKMKSYVEELSRVAEERGVIVSVAYMFRYHDAIDKMKEVIKEHGRPLMSITMSFNCAYVHSTRAYTWNIHKSGGPIVEQATHLCDLLRYFGGEIDYEQLTALAIPASDDPTEPGYLASLSPALDEQNIPNASRVPRLTQAQWKFTSGAVGSITHAVSIHGKKFIADVEVWADGLRMKLENLYTTDCKLMVRKGYTNEEEEFLFPSADPYYKEDEVFVKAIRARDNSAVRSSYEDAFKTYQLTWAIRRVSTGR